MIEKNAILEERHLGIKGSLTGDMRKLDLPPELMSYCQTMQKRFSDPIVEVRNGTCLACFINLSSSERQVIESGNGYGVCGSCGRILYYEDF